VTYCVFSFPEVWRKGNAPSWAFGQRNYRKHDVNRKSEKFSEKEEIKNSTRCFICCSTEKVREVSQQKQRMVLTVYEFIFFFVIRENHL